jgi:hypothetical protein
MGAKTIKGLGSFFQKLTTAHFTKEENAVSKLAILNIGKLHE